MSREKGPEGALVLVTAMTPTPAGEGKSTTTVGLGDAFRRLGKRTVIALREPSLGPVFGVKGGAAGGGHAQVVPMEDINLHFTGDLHAVTAAHNLLAALVDNHLVQGNRLGLDPRRIAWKRVLDMNDRALRHVVTGLGGPAHGVPRESGFEITAAHLDQTMKAQGVTVKYMVGTMIEIPRGSITADRVAQEAEFFSFGTNDLTQMTFGLSRDDVAARLMPRELELGLLPADPFRTLDGLLGTGCAARPHAARPDLRERAAVRRRARHSRRFCAQRRV